MALEGQAGGQRHHADHGDGRGPAHQRQGGRFPGPAGGGDQRHHCRRQQDHERPRVGIGVRAAEHVAHQPLGGHPHDEGQDGACGQEPTGPAHQERPDPDDQAQQGQHPRRLGPAVGELVAQAGQEAAEPAGLAVGHAHDGALHRGGGAVVGEQEEDRRQAPVAAPHQHRRDRAPDALGRGGRRQADRRRVRLPGPGPARGAGPAHEADEAVHEHAARRARQRAGRPRQQHAQPLAEDPDPEPTQAKDSARAGLTVGR